jgi:penicillin-binding protein 1C
MRWRLLPLLLVPLAGALLALDRALPPDLSRLERPAREVTDRDGRTLAVLPARGGVWRLPAEAAQAPPHLVEMLIAAEDRRFRAHPGVDPLALTRAAAQWVRAGRVVSGGSTLSMQAARLLEPRPRTLRAKAIEIARALQLEWRYGKEGVLGIWLTLAPQGGNIEGLRAGALAWFGRDWRSLDAGQAALLIALARRPEALRPDRHPDAARRARDAVLLARAAGAGDVSPAEREGALLLPVPQARLAMPSLAPHLARQVGQGTTTLDANLQRAAERLAAETRRLLPERASLAIVVADIATREVRALVGGAWMEEGRAGALDLTRAVRSPGSTLKPLIHAVAYGEGRARPDALVEDLPRRFGAYAPENFDRGFLGRVTVADSLRLSLNQPAVALLSEIGVNRLAVTMREAGAPPRLPAGAEPTLPLALGGVGVTLREMVALYATLADGGRAAPLRVQPGAPTEPRAVLDARAARQVGQVLTNRFPEGGPAGIAWKTGTSWGGRDAWALGFDARHVVGVWVGRPDGTPIPGLTGARAALPVLAQLFARLPEAPLPAAPRQVAPAPRLAGTDGLRLLFPPPGAVLEEGGRVVLRAMGGQRPLRFLVDGAPIPSDPARRDAAWEPPGPGLYRVTVLDASGGAARAELRVR